jgi:hypothetical protein
MHAHEVGETIAESAHGHHAEAHHGITDDTFRKRTAVFVGVIGMLLAIASLGGEYNMKDAINANIFSSDTYAFYQARNARQTSYQVALEDLEMTLATQPDMPAPAREVISKRIADYKGQIARFESDPKGGNGKKELLAKARTFEHERDEAQKKDINFDFARAFYEIAIVLGSVSIVAASRALVMLCGVLAIIGSVLSANGFMLLFDLAIH